MYNEHITSVKTHEPITTSADSHIERTVDPDGRLPQDFTIQAYDEQRMWDDRGMIVAWGIADRDGMSIGYCKLDIYDNNGSDNYVCFDGVQIDDPTYRGRGYGMATYVAAIEYAHSLGLAFRTQDWDQTEHAVKIWTKLRDLGIAREVVPFYPSEVKQVQKAGMGFVDEQRYKGLYVIDPPIAA